MHVHSSFSEQSGSMDSQLFQAATNSVDVLWWTDHDARMDGIGYRQTVHFTSLTAEEGGPGQGGAWTWTNAPVATSYHQAAGGRAAGDYTLSYQFVHSGVPASRVANGLQAVITIPVTPASAQNPWGTVAITPSRDIAALWPDLDYRDFGLFGLTLSAASNGDLVDGYFDYLRFNRQISGEAFLLQQMDMEAALAPKYPSVVQRQGLEVSWLLPHLNWFGGAVVIPDYGKTTPKTYTGYLRNTAVPQIHAAGGLVSYNHPYGYGDPAELPVAQQDALLAKVANALLPTATTPAALGSRLDRGRLQAAPGG